MARTRLRTKASTKKRTRTTKPREVTAEHSEEIELLIDGVSKDIGKIATLQARIKQNSELLEGLMVADGVRKVITSSHNAGEIVTPAVRATTSIDPEAFYNACADEEDFFSAISVPVGKAKEVLSAKELDKISTKGKTEQKPDQLKVTPSK